MRKIFSLFALVIAALAIPAPAFAAALGDTLNHIGNFDLMGLGALAAVAAAPLSTALQEKRGLLVTQAREALDAITANTDESRTAELEQRHDAIMAEFDTLEGQIAREDRTAAAEARFAERQAHRRPIGDGGEARGQENEDGVTYRTAFYRMLSVGGEVSELSSEERSILRTGFVKPEERAQTAGVAAAGGYTVPTELAGFIVQAMKAHGPMYDPGITTEIVTSSGNPIKVPTIDDTANEAGEHAEGAALTDDGGADVVIGQKALDAYVFDSEFIRFSFELAQDSAFNVEQLLGKLVGKRLGRKANRELTVGDGVGGPNGIVTASSLGKTAAAVAAITFDEIFDLEHAVDPAYRAMPSAGYMMADSTLQVIRKLKDGEGRYIWQMGDVTKGAPSTLNGRRYHINQHMDALAAAKKVMLFGDLAAYYVRKVGAPVIGVLKERFWPDLGIAGLIRFDGELGDTTAVKHLITAAA